MATRRHTPPSRASLPHGIPEDLARDGSPFTIITETTHSARQGPPPGLPDGSESQLTLGDVEDADWSVYLQTGSGFEFLDSIPGRPGDIDLRNTYGPGRYRVVPEGPDGHLLNQFAKLHKVLDLTKLDSETGGVPGGTNPWDGEPKKEGGMEPWMQYTMRKEAEERAEAQRMQREAAGREDDHRRRQEAAAWKRSEREEREQRERRAADTKDRAERYARERAERVEKDQKEREDRRHKADQMSDWVKLAASLLGPMLVSKNQPVALKNDSMNEIMLKYLMENRKTPEVAKPLGISEHLDLLLKLDTLRRSSPSEETKSDFDKVMEVGKTAVPALMGMVQARTQAKMEAANQGLLPPQPQPVDVEAVGRQVLGDSEMVARLMREDPDRYVDILMRTLKDNPDLQEVAVKKFTKAE